MGYDINDAYVNAQAQGEKIAELEAKVSFLYKLIEKIDKIIVAGGKDSVLEEAQKEVESESKEEETEDDGSFEELEEKQKKPAKKKKRPMAL